MRNIRTVVASLALAGAIISPTLASAVTRADLDASRGRAKAAREAAAEEDSRAEELLSETKRIEGEIGRISAEVTTLKTQIRAIGARRLKLEGEIGALRRRIVVKREQIARTEADLNRQRMLLDERVRSSYKQGDFFYLELILDARDWGDLVTRSSLVRTIMEQDDRIIDELGERRRDLERARTSLARDLQTLSIKRAQIVAEEDQLRRLRGDRTAKLAEQRAAEEEKTQLLDESKANAERLREIADAEERESARIQAELQRASSKGSGKYGGVMAWPVPSSQHVTSSYGSRMHPILGTRRFHAGIDISAASGADIVAAGSGTVIFAGYHGGYGNTVMIDHGDGLVTLYAHQSSIGVSYGQVVDKGQRVGAIGSTGLSTGPHLHFEIRVNGLPIDPLSYL